MNKIINIYNKILDISLRKIKDKLLQILSNISYKYFKKVAKCKPNNSTGFLIKMPIIVPQNYMDMLNGTYENIIIETINKNLNEDDLIVWDIGSHIGYQSLVFASNIHPKIKVFSFEPNPKNIEWFKENLKLNNNLNSKIKLIEKAFADKVEKVNFNTSDKYDSSSSGGFIDSVEPPEPQKVYKKFKKIPIQTTTIDTLIQSNLNIPDIIKIDVEGAELLVLQGGIETMKKYAPQLIIEIHNISMMFHVTKLLTDLDYVIEILDEENLMFTKIIYARKD